MNPKKEAISLARRGQKKLDSKFNNKIMNKWEFLTAITFMAFYFALVLVPVGAVGYFIYKIFKGAFILLYQLIDKI